MLDRNAVHMLAADHRWQLDDWCDAHGVARARIPELKALVADGFLLARERDEDAQRHGALLLDPQYGADAIARARAAGVDVGTPAEWPGAFPLRWAAEPFASALTGTFVKVLVRHRPDLDASVVEGQLAMLRELADWCRTAGQPLVLEVLVPRKDEPEAEFETTGRAPIVADYVRRAYAAGIVPDFWKMEGTTDAAAARTVDEAIVERDGPRFLVLGKGAGLDLLARWFAVARGMASAAGFAVGRSIYMEPGTAWLQGRVTREAATERVAETYRHLVRLWTTGR